MECHFHFETILLTDGDTEIRAVERADCIRAAHMLLCRRQIDYAFEGVDLQRKGPRDAVKREEACDRRWGAVDEATQRAFVICGREFARLEDGRRDRVDGFLIQFVIAEFHTGDVDGDIERAGLRSRIKNDGAAGPLEETAPNRYTQVIGLELGMRMTGVDGVGDRGGRREAGNSQ